jgi:endonuclease IV
MYKLGLKLWSINTGFYYEEAKKLYAQGIFDYIELYVVPDTLDTLPKWKKLNIPFIIHAPHFAHGFNLANKEKAQSNLEIYKEVKQFADELNAKYIIFHGGIDGSVEETAKQLATFNENRALIENKPYVALPNKMGGKFCRGATLEEISYIKDIAKCGFCLDIGHAICSANSQNKEQYSFLHELKSLNPTMFHLSDIEDMNSPYDAHPHLGTGQLDIERLKREIFPSDAIISVETNKDSKENLDDFVEDVKWLKNF